MFNVCWTLRSKFRHQGDPAPHPAVGIIHCRAASGRRLVGASRMIIYLRQTRPLGIVGRLGPPIFGVLMLAIQGYIFFGPPPASPAAAAVTALVSYVVFAAVAHWLDRNRESAAA